MSGTWAIGFTVAQSIELARSIRWVDGSPIEHFAFIHRRSDWFNVLDGIYFSCLWLIGQIVWADRLSVESMSLSFHWLIDNFKLWPSILLSLGVVLLCSSCRLKVYVAPDLLEARELRPREFSLPAASCSALPYHFLHLHIRMSRLYHRHPALPLLVSSSAQLGRPRGNIRCAPTQLIVLEPPQFIIFEAAHDSILIY